MWICPIANGHLQATGRDARGRKQHRYHERWREVRDENKYGRMLAFGRDLPRIRRLIRRHLAVPGLPRNKVLAAIVNLLEISLIRVGNEEYVRENGSFGLTTFRNRHAKVRGAVLRFQFRGKSHVQHTVEIEDRRLARIVKRCQDLPGQKLFQYLDEEGHKHPIDSDDVNAYVRELSGKDYTAKDYRTWAGTLLAIEATPCLSRLRFQNGGEAQRLPGNQGGRPPVGQYGGGVPKVLHPSSGDRGLSERPSVERDDRSSPPEGPSRERSCPARFVAPVPQSSIEIGAACGRSSF